MVFRVEFISNSNIVGKYIQCNLFALAVKQESKARQRFGFFPHVLKLVQINYIYSDNVCILPIKSGHPVIYQLKEMKPSVSPVYIYISMEFFFPEKIKFICTIVDSYWFPRLPVIALSNTEV